MITLLAKLLKALNADDNPSQIALAIVLAAFMGITPLYSPHNLIVLLAVLVLRVQLSMFILSLGVFTVFAYLLDPISDTLGLALLHAQSLQGLWTSLYNNDFWRLLAFNNSLVMGSVVLMLFLSLPLFFISRWLVTNYRQHILEWVQKTRLATWLKSGKLLAAYNGLSH